MLQVEEIEFQYPQSDYRLRIDHFACQAAQATAIVGPSGCGKTTFLNLAAGILHPSRGVVSVDGVEVSSLGDAMGATFRLTRIGLIFQEFELVEHLAVGDNILLPLHLGLRSQRPAIEAEAKRLAEHTGIAGYWRMHPRNLSHGERQRVAICRALSTKPSLVLADEPTGNLDPRNKRRVLDVMINTARERGQCLVVATHDVELLDAFDAVVQFEELNQFRETATP